MEFKFKTNPKALEQKNSATESSFKLQRTRLLFFALCCYLLSQSFTIPVLAIGPSWALWPNLPDLALVFLCLTFILNFRHTLCVSATIKRIFFILIVVLFSSILSYVFYLTSVAGSSTPGTVIGMYQIYRLFQFIPIFWIVAHIPLTWKRINTLGYIVDFVVVFVCLSVFLTFLRIVPLDLLTAHLPQGDVAGPWQRFAAYAQLGGGRGWGTIGYNHAYVSSQIIMLVSLSIHLKGGKKILVDNIFLTLSLLACFLSEARSGLAAMLFFAISYWFKKPRYAIITGIIAFFVVMTPLIIGANFSMVQLNSAEGGSIIERQMTLLDAGNTENLSGRDAIWSEKIKLLDAEPMRWFVGGGFGSITDFGDFGHMLPMQIIVETGIVGLLMFLILFIQILKSLYQKESGVKAIFWVTISFLLSSFSQDTFYPIPALGHFLGFYLCSVAIALREPST